MKRLSRPHGMRLLLPLVLVLGSLCPRADAQCTALGTGCGGGLFGVPNLTCIGGEPNVPNPTFGLRATGMGPLAPGLLLLGSPLPFPIPLPKPVMCGSGCSLELVPQFFFLTPANLLGIVTLTCPIPDDPALVGATVVAQAFSLNLLALCGNGTNGLSITLLP